MIFGAGNIGRGFMGQLFHEAGYRLIFVEYRRELVEMLNSAGEYPLRLLDAYSGKEVDLLIDDLEATAAEETDTVAELFATADVAGTAVGVNNLQAITPLVVVGIRRRMARGEGPVDIYLCENMYGAGDKLKAYVFEQLTTGERQWAEEHIGFVGTSVARMVPAPDKRFASEGPLFVVADAYHKWPYDKAARRAPAPAIEGMEGVNIEAEFARKLHTHNLGHAAMGYLGYLKGYTYVDETFRDDALLEIFRGALDETAGALAKRYPDDIREEEHREIIRDVIVRFGNPMLKDPLTRVVGDPIRKLGHNERIVGSIRLCMDYGIETGYIERVAGAAYCYDHPGDPKAVQLQEMISGQGIAAVIREVSGLDPAVAPGKGILENYHDFCRKKKKQ